MKKIRCEMVYKLEQKKDQVFQDVGHVFLNVNGQRGSTECQLGFDVFELISADKDGGLMNMMRTNSYRKVAKEDPEELRSRKAQYLINKVLEKADEVPRKRAPFKLTLRKLKTKIGMRIKRMRKTLRQGLSRVQACLQWSIAKRFNYHCKLSLCRKDASMLTPLFA
ncbi:hypothetical protein J5N97_027294 [Dioscorea zingiberensis]|uniref:Uncharacterized protein n=1 Tax=Dioscorea zingiberensis TaxID=325984 RepID=A0A9D5C462_9LILI|nr:hypothetical protein J5N97_027294 [Dioscorea zingiberensis]